MPLLFATKLRAAIHPSCDELDSELIAVKKAKDLVSAGLIHREAAILAALKDPLVLEPRAQLTGRTPLIISEFAGNGSLAGLLAANHQRGLCGPNRITKVIAGIPLAMRIAHSRGAVHRYLSLETLLLDLDRTMRISDFGDSASLSD
jgi:serine/threonine protein kinase